MTRQETPNTMEGFHVEDPVAAFVSFSQTGAPKPTGDATLHQEAVSLVLDRLSQRPGPVPCHGSNPA
ncbi:MAG: hypothetical protein HQL87_04565 [Magnetococcales bacterium]|nr:hypothetical protein [Magnetococcales bacterium]